MVLSSNFGVDNVHFPTFELMVFISTSLNWAGRGDYVNLCPLSIKNREADKKKKSRHFRGGCSDDTSYLQRPLKGNRSRNLGKSWKFIVFQFKICNVSPKKLTLSAIHGEDNHLWSLEWERGKINDFIKLRHEAGWHTVLGKNEYKRGNLFYTAKCVKCTHTYI